MLEPIKPNANPRYSMAQPEEMVKRAEQVQQIENALARYNIQRKEGESLENIYNNIAKRIGSLMDLREEMENVSKELYYYDIVDAICGIDSEKLTLKQCNALLVDLEKARKKFSEDSDKTYLKTVDDLTARITEIGIKRCKEVVVKERDSYDEVNRFLKPNKSAAIFVKNVYFAERKRILRNKIRECANDLEKHYQMLILGEMQLYKLVFNETNELQIETNQIWRGIEVIGEFGKYMEDLFYEIFRMCEIKTIMKIINELKDTTDKTSLTPEAIFVEVAIKYCGDKVNLKKIFTL